HAMQMPLDDGNVVTIYVLLGLVAVPGGHIDGTASLLARVANLTLTEEEGSVMWLDERSSKHFATYRLFETNPTQVISEFLIKHDLFDRLVTPDPLEFGSDTES